MKEQDFIQVKQYIKEKNLIVENVLGNDYENILKSEAFKKWKLKQ